MAPTTLDADWLIGVLEMVKVRFSKDKYLLLASEKRQMDNIIKILLKSEELPEGKKAPS
jgi:hypothetical protein